jgi:predicted component of type VI protein secretion system
MHHEYAAAGARIMMSPGSPDDEKTRLSLVVPRGLDGAPSAARPEPEVVAELRAALGAGDKKTLALHTAPETIVLGRGNSCDWQIEDVSLSRTHCQIKWSGRTITVEDLGSVNGTRVNGRPANRPTPFDKNDVLQLGTVTVTLIPLRTGAPAFDDVPTRRDLTVPPRDESVGDGSAPPPLEAIATVVSAAPETASPETQRFRPDTDAAGPDELTQRWDTQAALMRATEPGLVAALWARLKAAWHKNRRPFVLGGAVVWVALLLALMSWKQSRPAGDEEPVAPPSLSARGPAVKAPEPQPAVEPSSDRDQDLSDAVAAYDQGKLDEALRLFRRLAAHPDDKAAQLMVQLMEARSADDKGRTP